MNKVYFIVHTDSYIAKSYLTNELNVLNLIEYDFIDLNTLINKISQLDFFNEPKNYFINLFCSAIHSNRLIICYSYDRTLNQIK